MSHHLTDADRERISKVQATYAHSLMQKANVVGVAMGMKKTGDSTTETPALVVMVTQKVAVTELDETDVIPVEIDGVPTDVQVMGMFSAQ